MKLNPNTRYAVRLLFELSDSAAPLSLATLSQRTGIAQRAVENVHNTLRHKGITRGSVGPKGGIHLCKQLADISLGQLVAWFDEGVELSVCCGEKANNCPKRPLCATNSAWKGASNRLLNAMNAVFLADIKNGTFRGIS